MKKIFIPLISILLLTSCNKEEKLKLVLDSYLGYNQSALLQNFGNPKRTYYDGANKVVEFEFVEHYFNVSPNNTASSLNTPSARGAIQANGSSGLGFNYGDMQGSYSKDECKLSFTIDSRNLVKDWHQAGNNCTEYATRENINHQYLADLPRIMEKTYGFDFTRSSSGMKVKEINPFSHAQQAGLMPGDIITKINNINVSNLPVEVAKDELNKNSQAKLILIRNKEEKELLVKKSEISRLHLYDESLQKFMKL